MLWGWGEFMLDRCAPTARIVRLRGRWGAALALLLAFAAPYVAAADDTRFEATSHASAEKEARAAVPWDQLSPADKKRVERVVDHAALYRRLPTRVVPCDPEVFDFLVRRPEVVTSVWNLMSISKLTVERESENIFQAEDHVGGQGRFEVLHSHRDTDARGVTIAIVDGLYHQKPMPRPIRAQCVLLLRSGSTIETNGKPYITARLDAFVKFDRVAADLVARGLQPLIAQTADHNFVETMKFVATFSRTAERNPAGMRRLAVRLTDIDAQSRAEMIDVCTRTHQRAEALAVARSAEQTRLAQLRREAASQ